jgi:hypothetical protein
MKKMLVLLPLFALFATTAIAQPRNGDRKAEIEAQKIAFITKKLSLTPAEAKVFWPVYDEHQGKQQEIRKQRKQNKRSIKGQFDTASDQEIEEAMDLQMKLKTDEASLAAQYHEEYKKVLPVRKVAKLYAAEEQFKKILLQRMQERKSNNGGSPRRRP